jgi:transposase-like protein
MNTSAPACRRCGSQVRQIRYGRNRCGNQRFRCHACASVYTAHPKPRGYATALRQQALRMYLDGLNFRRIGRLLGVSHQTVVNWVNDYHARLQEQHPDPPRPAPQQVLTVELDEMYVRLQKKGTGPM